MATPMKPTISVDVNPAPAAEQLREVGGWGVAIIFLLLLFAVWRHFTKATKALIDKHNETIQSYVTTVTDNEQKHVVELKNQREEFMGQMVEQQKELSELLERRHEQFIQLIRDNQNTITTAIEVNRQGVDLMSRVDESMKDVDRVIKRCKNARPTTDD